MFRGYRLYLSKILLEYRYEKIMAVFFCFLTLPSLGFGNASNCHFKNILDLLNQVYDNYKWQF